MFKETLESTQNSKYQRAHFRMMMREPEFLIPGNGKKYKKRRGRGLILMIFSSSMANCT